MKLFVVPNTLTKLQNAGKTNITVIYSRPDLGFGTPTLPTSFFTRTCNNINRQKNIVPRNYDNHYSTGFN